MRVHGDSCGGLLEAKISDLIFASSGLPTWPLKRSCISGRSRLAPLQGAMFNSQRHFVIIKPAPYVHSVQSVDLLNLVYKSFEFINPNSCPPDLPSRHHPCFRRDRFCYVAFDRSSLRRIAPYASVVSPRRLTSNTLLVIRIAIKPANFTHNTQTSP